MMNYVCRICGKTFNTDENLTTDSCGFCGATNTLPAVNDADLIKKFNEAANERFQNNFKKADAIYDDILNKVPTNSEAHFGKIMCLYGFSYEENSFTGTKNPVCLNKIGNDVFNENNYNLCISNAKPDAKEIYETVAYQISMDQKQTGIKKEVESGNKYDIFISSNTTDEWGKPLKEVPYAFSLYDYLVSKGYKVFYAPKTLEDKDYDERPPFVEEAINCAKIMIIVGSKPESFVTPIVQGEWEQFTQIIRRSENDALYLIIQCHMHVDVNALPNMLRDYPVVDIAPGNFEEEVYKLSLGYAKPSGKASALKKSEVVVAPNMKKREESKKAAEKEKAEAEKAKKEEAKKAEDQKNGKPAPIEEVKPAEPEYTPGIEFGDNKDAEKKYKKAVKLQEKAKSDADFREAAGLFKQVIEYTDAQKRYDECMNQANEFHKELLYNEAMKNYKKSTFAADYNRTKMMLDTIPGYKDADMKGRECFILANRLKKEEEQKKKNQKPESLIVDGQIAFEPDKKMMATQKYLKIVMIAVTAIVVIAAAIPFINSLAGI